MIPIKKFICVVLALGLLAAAIGIIYPELLTRFVSEEKINQLLCPAQVRLGDECLGLESFPLYGSENFYGVRDALDTFADYLNGTSAKMPSPMVELKTIAANSTFFSVFLEFLTLALLSIPVYMVLRYVPYNTLYAEVSAQSSILVKLFGRGILCLASGVTAVGISWFLYNSVFVARFLEFVRSYANVAKISYFAMGVSNVVLMVVVVLITLKLVKTTLFRGSVLSSVFMALLRMVLFLLAFACVEVFAGRVTLRLVLFAVAAVFAVGIVKSAVEPN